MTWCKSHKWSALLGLGLLGIVTSVAWAAYTRDPGGNEMRAVLVALEYLISDGVTTNAGTNLNTSALATEATATAIDGHVDGLEAAAATLTAGSGGLPVPASGSFSVVKIEQGAAGRTTLKAADGTKVVYLHALVGTITTAGTITVLYDDDGAGTNEAAITGTIPLSATGGFVIPFVAPKVACPATAAGKYMTIVTTGDDFHGYAIVSQE